MPKVHRSRTFRYKVAEFSNAVGKKQLQQRIKEAFTTSPKPAKRTQLMGADEKDPHRVVIFYRTEHKGLTCGILQRFRKGAAALATVMDDDADNYEIKQFKIQNDPKNKQTTEFAKSLMFFGIRGNHLIISEGRGFGSAELESHLTWLLSNHSPVKIDAQAGFAVALNDNIPPKYAGRSIAKTKEVRLFTEPDVVAAPAVPSNVPAQGKSENVLAQAQTWSLGDDPLIHAVLAMIQRKNPSITREQLFTVKDAFQRGAMRAELVFKFMGIGKAETSPLDQLARTLRHVNDVKYEIKLPHGEPLTSNQTKISRKLNIVVNEDVPDAESVFSQMASMLDDLVQAGDIVPDP